ncbi:hypothetical protein BJY01DRAFT_250469 [Aspergillus pseudoustus]|uniref:Carboxylic ester hydrolase n=1 Tax=Aspergillus pseudoustus TaxID=1810923 RepID=A0ABR4JHK2_9EURO
MSHLVDTAYYGGHNHSPGVEYESVSSLGSPPSSELEKPLERPGWFARLVDTWLYEFLAILFSIACMGGVAVILIIYDGEPQPSFAYGVTLNALISLLGTVSKSSLIFVIGECMGQLKWVWFYTAEKSRHQRLEHMQYFDSASRGPLGSLLIILRHRGVSFVSLGALIIIVALLFDPFMQQIIKYPLREIDTVNGTNAAAQRAYALLPETLQDSVPTIIYTGMWGSDFEVEPTCPSGNCTWPSFESVGMCSRCEDITTQVKFDNCNGTMDTTETGTPQPIWCDIVLPQGNYIGDTYRAVTNLNINSVQWSLDFPAHMVWVPDYQISAGSNETYAGIQNPLVVVAYAQLGLVHDTNETDTPAFDPAAALRITNVTQCAMSLCTRTYDIAVSDGIPTINVSAPTFGKVFDNPRNTGYSCWRPGNDSSPVDITQLTNTSYADPNEFAFCPTGSGDYRLFEYFEGEIRSYNRTSGSAGRWINNEEKFNQGALGNTNLRPRVPLVERIGAAGLEFVMDNVAASFTKAGLVASTATVAGTVRTAEVYVHVEWWWLILPAALVVLGTVFWLLTMAINRHQRLRLWKSSVLALLFHGLDSVPQYEEQDRFATASKMDQTAQSLPVKLDISDQRKGFMLHRA